MGWTGYGLYDGDGTFTTQMWILEKIGIDEAFVDEHYATQDIIKLTEEHRLFVTKKYPAIIKLLGSKSPKNGDMEDWAINWQMFADLIMNNNLPLTKQIKDCATKANEWMKGDDHAGEFDEPRLRRVHLNNFGRRLKTYKPKKVIKSKKQWTKRDKKKFISLIDKYNKAADNEHDCYMNRGNGSWYKIRAKLDKKIEKANNEFKKTFKSLIPKTEYKDFSLGYYETDDPEEMCDVWFNEDVSE